MIIAPTTTRAKSIGHITIAGNVVDARFPEKDEQWRLVCKKFLYTWEVNRWVRKFDRSVIQHRAAELAHNLLRAGFIVQVDDVIAELIENVSYKPESFRNVRAYTKGEYDGWFVFTWAKTEDLYALVTRLPSAHWDGTAVVVRNEYYEEVLAFAETHGFEVSDAALALAEKARQTNADIIVIDVPPLPKPADASGQRPTLRAPEFVEIDRELVDDEYDNSAA